MSTSLNNLRQIIGKKIVLFVLVSASLIFFLLIVTQLSKKKSAQETVSYTPIASQPVENGKFNTQAPVSQKSKTSLEKIKSQLPLTQTITTSTGTQVKVLLHAKDTDAYTLYLEIGSINFRSNGQDPMLAKNILDFRETARYVFNLLENKSINPKDIFIVWGTKAYIQQNAEAWLNESPKYPKVVKKGDAFVFEKEPQK